MALNLGKLLLFLTFIHDDTLIPSNRDLEKWLKKYFEGMLDHRINDMVKNMIFNTFYFSDIYWNIKPIQHSKVYIRHIINKSILQNAKEGVLL